MQKPSVFLILLVAVHASEGYRVRVLANQLPAGRTDHSIFADVGEVLRKDLDSNMNFSQFSDVFNEFKKRLLESSFRERLHYFTVRNSSSGDSFFRLLLLFQCVIHIARQQNPPRPFPNFSERDKASYPNDEGPPELRLVKEDVVSIVNNVDLFINNLATSVEHPKAGGLMGVLEQMPKILWPVQYAKAWSDAALTLGNGVINVATHVDVAEDKMYHDFMTMARADNDKLKGINFADIHLNIYGAKTDLDLPIIGVIPYVILPERFPARPVGAWHATLLVKLENEKLFMVNADGGLLDPNRDFGSPLHLSVDKEGLKHCIIDVYADATPWHSFIAEVDSKHLEPNPEDGQRERAGDRRDVCAYRSTFAERLACVFKSITEKFYLDKSVHFFDVDGRDVGGVWRSYTEKDTLSNLMHKVPQGHARITLRNLASIQASIPGYNLGRRNCQHFTSMVYTILTGHVMNLPSRSPQIASLVYLIDPLRYDVGSYQNSSARSLEVGGVERPVHLKWFSKFEHFSNTPSVDDWIWPPFVSVIP
eukprot:TRINITY_DN64941_c0_g1_i1.p1 TRINITY_DN64941_c0_g1~~TRINITY_DN64941_c0_g1_i1.p1  ORF type:complete len:536 (+),score=28.74 TRINITY_DN64941_c0_g1_i1:52-1659(+)